MLGVFTVPSKSLIRCFAVQRSSLVRPPVEGCLEPGKEGRRGVHDSPVSEKVGPIGSTKVAGAKRPTGLIHPLMVK